jgi:hypothetical protein
VVSETYRGTETEKAYQRDESCKLENSREKEKVEKVRLLNWIFERPLPERIQLRGRISERFHEFVFNRDNPDQPWDITLNDRYIGKLRTDGEYKIGLPDKIYYVDDYPVPGEELLEHLRNLRRR